ncbi:formimidoylglutamate deiminase [Sinimarinibacterium sp. CAU 1509]|uniref:formimidoylglutamate deiminase n=1 Tax=Sinimarinibacterium sp. CAU 1509 TaxID=2562283 RepID=UPI0010AC310C|nr:formimidoylglutamate deiminase [Sinimarinibacterium sp. CAU 1509]TJY59541.1 formimidoylglutamate deiminase [Sinimarinibacterium sp. CAU 1509]
MNASTPQRYFAADAWLPDGWARNVVFNVDAAGMIEDVALGGDALGAEILRGPVIPAMPNLHSHAFQRAMAGLTQRAGSHADSFWSWRECMYRFVERLTPDDIEVIATQLYIELLQQGYTSVGEFHYLHHDARGRRYRDPAETSRRIIGAAQCAGIELSLLPVLYRHAGFGGEAPSEAQRRFVCTLEDYARIVEALGGERAYVLGFAPHSLRAVTPESLEQLLALRAAVAPQAPLHLHIAEQQREVEDCLAWSGLRPVEWLLQNVSVDGSWCLVHATHMRDIEAVSLATRGAVVGLCPSTEADLGDGIFNAEAFVMAGGRIGIGSDSQVGVSPWAELRGFEYSQRLQRRRRNVFVQQADVSVGAELYRCAQLGGAQALGQPVMGLAPGQRADWVVLNMDDPALVEQAPQTLLDAAVFGPAQRPVRDVMVGGHWRVRDGVHPGAEAALPAYRKTLRRLLA